MRLAVDVNILVSEINRERGRLLLASSGLELYMTERIWDELKNVLLLS